MSNEKPILAKLLPEYTKEEFLRKTWITMARDDVPFSVFENCDVKIITLNHRVLDDTLAYGASWEAEIGNNRTETYTDYENYQEKIPYTDYETYYDNGQRRQRAVTKYRYETRQRAVTKTRTVTDWYFTNGTHSDETRAVVETIPGIQLDTSRYLYDFARGKKENTVILNEGDDPNMSVTEAILDVATPQHRSNIKSQVEASLPGDKNRGLSYDITSAYHKNTFLLSAPEYIADISYLGKKYTKRAFAFGTMQVEGAKIPNVESAESRRSEINKKANAEIQKISNTCDKNIESRSFIPAVGSLGILAASIIVSLFVHFTFLVVAMLLAGIAGFIASRMLFKKIEASETAIANDKQQKIKSAAAKEIANYSTNHKEQLLEKLNKKLASLGLKEATINEI